MTIKRIIAFVLLAVLIYGGVYITVFGFGEYMRFSRVERVFRGKPEDLAHGLNIKGSVETVTEKLGSEDITRKILGIPIGGKAKRYFYALPLGYAEDKEDQKYCVIAVVDEKDVETLDGLLKSSPAPSDPNAPRFEFRGYVINSYLDVQTALSNYLKDVYTRDSLIPIPKLKNVNKYIAPYTIYVKTAVDDNYPMTITIGLIAALIGAGLFVILAVRTYRKAHEYD